MSQPIKLKPLSRILKDEIKERLTNLGIDFTGIKLKVDLYKILQEALGIVPNQSQIPIANANKDEPKLLKFDQGPVFRRIPKASRHSASVAFEKVSQKVIDFNDLQAWTEFFSFARGAIGSSKRGGKKRTSQATIINKRIEAFMAGENTDPQIIKRKKPPLLKNLVSAKIAVADIQGAVRIISSKESILPQSAETVEKLKEKHPQAHPDSTKPPDCIEEDNCFKTNKENLLKAIRSFKRGTSGGPDGLLPQHLIDMTGEELGEPASKLADTLVTLLNTIIYPGKVPPEVIETFYGANLIALGKEDGGVRPIAIGFTLRRLAAKLIMFAHKDFSKQEFQPNQLGVGTPKGAEAAVHALRSYLENPETKDKVLLKIDFKNAFNMIRRDKILDLVKKKLPKIYNFVYQEYAEKTSLRFGSEIIKSNEGVQQGDPLGPFLFSLGIQDLIKNCKSEFNAWYLDDGTLAGDVETVLTDAKTITLAANSHGLIVNPKKSELFLIRPESILCKDAPKFFNTIMEGIKIVERNDLKLLGAPIFPEAIESVLGPKIENLILMTERLKQIDSHEAMFLLRHCYGIPKFTYFLRTAPCFMKPNILDKFDNIIKEALVDILNISMPQNAYSQATLPIANGGLGLRLATDIALVGFLSSVCATSEIVKMLLPPNQTIEKNQFWEKAFSNWKQLTAQTTKPEVPIYQSNWDKELIEQRYQEILHSASIEEKARLLAVSSPSSSDWLHAIPIPSLGLKLDPMSLKIACGLRLGSTLCHPHNCICGVEVDAKGRHGLSCKRQTGRHSRHTQINDILKKALVQAKIPATTEPVGLSRSDGKRPDGLTLATWKQGKCLIWDATVADTLCQSYVYQSSKNPGAAAEIRENEKNKKYQDLAKDYFFVPIGIETYGSWGTEGLKLIKTIGQKLKEATGERQSTFFLTQNISMAIQRGNASCVLGTVPRSEGLEEIFEFVTTQPQ